MQFILGPKQDRPLTIVMTEQQGQDIVDRFGAAYGTGSSLNSRSAGEKALAELFIGIREKLRRDRVI